MSSSFIYVLKESSFPILILEPTTPKLSPLSVGSTKLVPGKARYKRKYEARVGRIPPEQIELVRERADIIAIIGERLTLTQKGRQFWANCPFHGEKTASFSVHPDRQIYKCFGCQKGGNVFGFLQEYDHLSFPEAVRLVADTVGIEIQEEKQSKAAHKRQSERKNLLDVADAACQFFESQLWASRGQIAQDYLTNRGITHESAKKFRLGVAPPGWDNLLNWARKSNIAEESLVKLGLLVQRENEGRSRSYDRFRDRLMFPISDDRGRVIAFGGRRFNDDPETPKYINSSEVPGLFEKRRILYGLHHAKEARVTKLIIVEGYTDVIMSLQAGVEGVVAVLGTAFGPDHIPLVRRFAQQVVVLFDGDAAGQAAAQRSLAPLVPMDMEVRVAILEGAKDPADLIVEKGAQGLIKLVEDAPEVFDYLLDSLQGQAQSSLQVRAKAIESILKLLAPMDSIRLHLHLGRFAHRFAVPEDELRERMKAVRQKLNEKKQGPNSKSQDSNSKDQAKQRKRSWTPNRKTGERWKKKEIDPFENAPLPPKTPNFGRGAELKILEALLACPKHIPRIFSILNLQHFSEGPSRQLALRLQVAADLGQTVSEATLYNELEGQQLELLRYLGAKIHEGQQRQKDYESELDDAACQRIVKTLRKQQREEVRRLLREAIRDGREQDALDLEKELDSLFKANQTVREH
jgi:DNA primase